MRTERQPSGIFRDQRPQLIRSLFAAIRNKTSASWTQSQNFEEVEPWGMGQMSTTVDLFAQWLETRDPLFQELFEGWVRSWIVSHLSSEGIPADYKPDRVIQIAKASWIEILKPSCSSAVIESLANDLDDSICRLAKKPLRHLKILFIGDCIQFEIVSALLAAAYRDQIQITPVTLNEKVQPILRNQIRSMAPEQFDLVFFSPFSHRYLSEYEILLTVNSLLWSRSRIAEHLKQMLDEIARTIETLVSHLQCKIYVHNTAGTIQFFGLWSDFAKNLASWTNRKHVRQRINAAILGLLNERVHLIDENSLRSGSSDFALGKVYFDSYAFHPTPLGVALGRELYYEAVYTNAFLAGKKVIVCDLDDTLWDGAIGEGPVKHFLERQELLLQLKKKGMLLSINSKNDSRNVRWLEARLRLEDFVAPQINWDTKVRNMTRIREALNLQLKDFVFIDDRPDELERMQNALPDVLALDAAKNSTWQLLSHWQRILPSSPEQDRTELYHARADREQFIAEAEDEAAALAALRLTVRIRPAQSSDLKRAAELINRTNQFNLCGSRTTPRELEGRPVIIAEASDKFGAMGIIGIMVVGRAADAIEIPVFVLSCRVFGFGIEYALLHSVKQVHPKGGLVVGHYKETQFNEPCRSLYPNSGFSWNGQHWMGNIADLPPDPAWLAVHREISPFPDDPTRTVLQDAKI